MKVLVTNDDGVASPGLHALVRALTGDGRDVEVAAPDRDMSGSGAAIGRIHLDEHIDAQPVELPGLAGVPAYAVDGPPGLCVLAARLGGFGPPPDVVVSGINPGCNTGRAVLHSGTVGAALTAANLGCRGLAVSIDVRPGPAADGSTGPRHWATAAQVAAAAPPVAGGGAGGHGPQPQRARPAGRAAGRRPLGHPAPSSAPSARPWSSRRRAAGACRWSCAPPTTSCPPTVTRRWSSGARGGVPHHRHPARRGLRRERGAPGGRDGGPEDGATPPW